MASGNIEGRFEHYGLEFILRSSDDQIRDTIKTLAKPNRMAKEIKIDGFKKKALKLQLSARMKIRRREEDRRRKEFPR